MRIFLISAICCTFAAPALSADAPSMTIQELSVRDQAAFNAMAEVRTFLEQKFGTTRGDLDVAHVLIDTLRAENADLRKQVDDLKAKCEPPPAPADPAAH